MPVVEDTSNRESEKVDLSEKSGKSKVYNAEIEENPASISKEIEESSNTKLASDTESSAFAPSPGFAFPQKCSKNMTVFRPLVRALSNPSGKKFLTAVFLHESTLLSI